MNGTDNMPSELLIEGYAAVFGEVDLAGDVIRRGAFARALEKTRKLIPTRHGYVKMLYQHAADRPVGRWLEMKEDARGLYVKGEVFTGTSDGRNLFHLLRGGALDGLSIGFKPVRARRSRGGRRELLDIDLWEISLVTFPMAAGARLTRVRTEPAPRNLLQS